MVKNFINERIAKKIANSGLCSRREAERLINNGCVKLNGNVIKNCNIDVTTKDIIEVNNQKLKVKEKVKLWLYYKKIAIDKALLKTNKRYLDNCDIWVTLQPCEMCMGMIRQVRIKRLYYGASIPHNSIKNKS